MPFDNVIVIIHRTLDVGNQLCCVHDETRWRIRLSYTKSKIQRAFSEKKLAYVVQIDNFVTSHLFIQADLNAEFFSTCFDDERGQVII